MDLQPTGEKTASFSKNYNKKTLFLFAMRRQKKIIVKIVQHSYSQQAQGGYESLCVEMDYL